MFGCRFSGRRAGSGEHYARLNVRLSAALVEQVAASAKREGVTVSEVVRLLLVQYVRPKEGALIEVQARPGGAS